MSFRDVLHDHAIKITLLAGLAIFLVLYSLLSRNHWYRLVLVMASIAEIGLGAVIVLLAAGAIPAEYMSPQPATFAWLGGGLAVLAVLANRIAFVWVATIRAETTPAAKPVPAPLPGVAHK